MENKEMASLASAPTAPAQWLRSPVSERAVRLRPMSEAWLDPYHGHRRKVRLVRTTYVIGSDDTCDIRLNDPFVSARHAEITLEADGQGYCVRDLDSRNGTFVNGTRVSHAPLFAGAALRMGRSSLAWKEIELTVDDLPKDCIAADEKMKAVLVAARQVAMSGLPVLLLGETGTGKDVIARLIHRWSARGRSPYVAVNGGSTGGSLAESELFGHRKGAYTGAESARLGALRSANGGTLFLDEVADIPPSAQVKLLRALENGEVKALGADHAERADFRLVSATSQDLEQKIETGAFRADLYFRIAGYVLHVPPLRERPADVLEIARVYLAEAGMELDAEADGRLLSYAWPGNIRELKSVLERARLLARADASWRVQPRHLGGMDRALQKPPASGRRPISLDEMEREHIRASLERNGWSRTVSSRELGIARSTLFEKMRRYGMRDEA